MDSRPLVPGPASKPVLFRTVATDGPLGLLRSGVVDGRRLADFLDLPAADVARLAGVAATSVRYDGKIPRRLEETLADLANLCELVAGFFGGDAVRTALWFRTPNPELADEPPIALLRAGDLARLRRCVLDVVCAVPALTPAIGNPVFRLDPHLAEIVALCERHGVRRLAVFGSALTAGFDPRRSDIDLVVEFDRNHPAYSGRQYFDFKSALEALLDRPVDLVEIDGMPDTRLKRAILREQRPIYEQAA